MSRFIVYLFGVLNDLLTPIRTRRYELAQDLPAVYNMLLTGSQRANEVAARTLTEVRDAIGLNYFDNARSTNRVQEDVL